MDILTNIDMFFDTIDFAIDDNLNPIFKLSRDKLKIFLYLILIVPLALGLRFLKNSTARLLYNLFWGHFFVLFLARDWFLYVNAITVFNYGLIKFFNKKCFIPVTAMSFIALSYAHYVRWINIDQQWRIDFNVIQMIITCRYVYFAAEYDDGKLDKLRVSFLDYYSYIFLFTNIIVGALPFYDFYHFINLTGQFTKMRFTLKPAMISLTKAILFTIGEVAVRPYFDFNWFDSNRWQGMTLLQRQGMMMIISICARFKYFLAFKFTQAAMDSGGITFNGLDNKGQQLYTKHSTGDYRFEIGVNAYVKTTHWNSTVQMWLKTCFFDRFSSKYGQKTFYITFILSAVWHGFFFIYYFFFIEWAIFNQVAKYFYIAQNKFSIIPQPIRIIAAWLFTTIVVNSIAIPVSLLQWERGLKLTNDLCWTAQILVFSLFIFFYLTQWGQERPKKLKKT